MKRIFAFIAISIVGFSAFSSCQKYNYNPSMSAGIDTVSFKSTGETKVTAHVDTFTHNPQLVIITGTSDTYTPGTAYLPVIVLTAPNIIGSYAIDTNNKTRSAMVYTVATGAAGSVAVSGQINVLSIDGGKIKGNFTLVCANGQHVNNGQYVAIESYY